MKMQLDHVRLLVPDYSACFRFYRDVMGFRVRWGEEEGDYADFEVSQQTRLSLFGRQRMAQAVGAAGLPADAPCQDRMLLTFRVDDLEKAMEQLRARGAQFLGGAQEHPEWGIRAAYLRDPAGTLIELNVSMPEEAWTPVLREEAQQARTHWQWRPAS